MAERTLNLNLVSKVARAAGTASNVISGIGGGSFSGIGGAFGPAGAVAGTILDKITGFAAKANPQAFEQLEKVFEDLAAIVGKVFVPPLLIITKVFRILADALTPIIDKISQLAEAIGQFISDLIDKLPDWMRPGKGTSVGRAPGGAASLVGVGALGDMARQSAYSAGGSAAQQTANNTKLLVDMVKNAIGKATDEGTKRAIDGTGGGGSF